MAQPSPGGQAIQIIVQINVFSFSQTISQQIYAMIEDKWNVRPFLGCDLFLADQCVKHLATVETWHGFYDNIMCYVQVLGIENNRTLV